jgi:hypothetical protein
VKLTAQRVTRILDPKQSKSERVPAGKAWLPALGLVMAFSAVGLVSLPHVPKLVAFENGASPSEFAAGEQAAHFGAKMVPAKFTEDISNFNSFHTTAAPGAGPIKNNKPLLRHAAMVTTAAQLAKPVVATPRLLKARAEDPSVQAAPKAVFVVMQTEQIDDFGRVWNICVWRFTVYHSGDSPVDHEVQKGITPKST